MNDVQRLWTGALLVVVVSVLLLAPDRAAPPSFDVPLEYHDRLLALDKAAVEAAYTQQVVHLFGTWMKDETGQPERMTKGIRQAQRAYVEAMKALEQREKTP